MAFQRLLHPMLRLFYRHFYNRLAFTYDPVSTLVSRGEWRAWTQAAIPFLRGPRILEVAVGTGNLQTDLWRRGYELTGIDLSPFMLHLTQSKLAAVGVQPRLAQARVQQLPFPAASFDSIVLTFPAGFVNEQASMRELRRVIKASGDLVWVDGPDLYPIDSWSRFLNWLFRLTSGETRERQAAGWPGDLEAWEAFGWTWRMERVERSKSAVHVIVLSPAIGES